MLAFGCLHLAHQEDDTLFCVSAWNDNGYFGARVRNIFFSKFDRKIADLTDPTSQCQLWKIDAFWHQEVVEFIPNPRFARAGLQ